VARSRYTNVSSTLNQVIGIRNTEALFMRGAAPLQEAFFFTVEQEWICGETAVECLWECIQMLL
jgi:hypothetical protein